VAAAATDTNLPSVILHASCVAVNKRALLIRGASGTGKSALAMQMMALGADLVADDRTELTSENEQIIARCPPAISGLIEARGVGILRANASEQARIVAVLDLDQTETDRLPPIREVEILGQMLPLYYIYDIPSFAGAMMQLLQFGRHA
jgi:HPr kinase/phosphorylase